MKALLPSLAVAVAAVPVPASLNVKGVAYGRQEVIGGTWFTNFENSWFDECTGRQCGSHPVGEEASIACLSQMCEALDRAARRLTHQKDMDAPSGSFEIRFVGRRGLYPHEPRWLGDGGRNVLIERLLSVRKASDQ